jgi:transcriptional regulator with XRE-family HTH domain
VNTRDRKWWIAALKSRIGQNLKAARARAGWSREALAYHSGVSWSAISQIESGRRKDVRLSSLSALAYALDLSVDYLIGSSTAIAPRLLEHRALAYESDEEFLEAAVPFINEGNDRAHGLLAVTNQAQITLLREALEDRAKHVEFVDSLDWYSSPNDALDRYRVFVKQKFDEGMAWIRIVGEPVWAGRSEAEIAAWTRYESMLNLSLASAPATIVCPYDARALPEEVVADARTTHPEMTRGSHASANTAYQDAEHFLMEPQTSR